MFYFIINAGLRSKVNKRAIVHTVSNVFFLFNAAGIKHLVLPALSEIEADRFLWAFHELLCANLRSVMDGGRQFVLIGSWASTRAMRSSSCCYCCVRVRTLPSFHLPSCPADTPLRAVCCSEEEEKKRTNSMNMSMAKLGSTWGHEGRVMNLVLPLLPCGLCLSCFSCQKKS